MGVAGGGALGMIGSSSGGGFRPALKSDSFGVSFGESGRGQNRFKCFQSTAKLSGSGLNFENCGSEPWDNVAL